MATIPINDTETRDEYTSASSQTTFPYTFWVKEEDHLDVYVNGTLKTLTTDYTVSAVQETSGANVVFNSGLTSGDVVVITLAPDVERLTEFQQSGSFRASALNLELTYITSLLQWLKTKLGRTLTLSDTATGSVSTTLPDPSASKYLRWNSSANALENASGTGAVADINDLGDVTITSAATGEVLKYNGSAWVNDTLSGAGDMLIATYDAAGVSEQLVGLTASQTLTNKTLTSPVISTISNTGTLTLPTSTDTLVGRDTTDTLTSKTLTSPVLNTGVSGTAILDEDNMASDSATKLATQQSIKAYVDNVAVEDLSNTTITTPSSGQVLKYNGSIWINDTVAGAGGDAWSDAVNADIVPTGADSTYDLGSNTDRFAQAYIDDATLTGGLTASTESTWAQSSATRFVDTTSIPYNLTLDNPLMTVSSYDTSNNASTVHYSFLASCEKASGSTDAAAIGGEAITAGSSVDIWAATLNATADSGHGSCTIHGLEIAVRDFGAATNSSYGLVLVGMGNNSLDAAIQIQSNLGGSGTNATFDKGIVFNNSPKDVITGALMYDSAGSPTRGIHFQNTAFGSHGIHLDNITGTYGIQVTGSPSIGFEHDGSSATAAFRAHGSGTTAYKIDSTASYTNGIDFRGCNFSTGYEIATDAFQVENSGNVHFSNSSTTATPGSLATYVRLKVNGTDYWVPCYN